MPRKRKKAPLTRKDGETRGRKPIVELRLQFSHSINGTQYGPGVVEVPEPTAKVLMEQERNVERTQRYLSTGGHALIGVHGVGSKLIPVPASFFEGDALIRTTPTIVIPGH